MTALRFTYVFAASLCWGSALLVTGSLFIADRAPQSLNFFIISIIVSGLLFSIGVILLGIQRHLSFIGRFLTGIEAKFEAEKSWCMLSVYMILGGLMLSFVLLIITYATITRIDQGFAVFG
jgi:hypothetical protein